MQRFEDETFVEKTVVVDGNAYVNCHFKHCTIIFAGRELPVMPNCVYESCSFGLEGRAKLTGDWLRHLFSAGGQDLVLVALGISPDGVDS